MTLEETAQFSIFNKSFHIKCAPEKLADLELAIERLDSKMRDISRGGKTLGYLNTALMAAIQLSYELVHAERHKDDYLEAVSVRIKDLTAKVDFVLGG